MTPQRWPEIEKALQNARFFVLLADPESARSEWVQKEIDCWRCLGRMEGMLIVWTGGELVWDKNTRDFDWDRTTSLPRSLAGAFGGEVPLYLDLRWARTEVHLSRRHPEFAKVLARLSATIRGMSLDEVFGEDVRQRRRNLLFLWSGIVVLSSATLLAGWQWWRELEAHREAQSQAKAAEDARDQGDGLIDFVLYDLRDKLEPIGRLEVLDDVVKKAKEYLDKLPKKSLTPSRLKQQGNLLNNLGDVLVAQGKLPEALATYEQALTIAEALAGQDKSNSDWQRDLSVSFNNVGDVLRAQGKLPKALAAYQQCLAIAKSLLEQDKSNIVWRQGLSVSYEKIGDVLKAEGKLAEALTAFQRCRAINQILVGQDKTNSDWQEELSISFDKMGDVLRAQGKLAEALASYQQAWTIAKSLAKQDKRNSTWQQDVSTGYEKVGDVLWAQGKLAEALALYQECLTIRQILVERDKTNSGWQRALIVALDRVGIATAKKGSQDAIIRARELLGMALDFANRYAGADRQELIDALNQELQNIGH